MTTTYTLNILCPHCGFRHAITAWPAAAQDPVLFTCLVKWGGCGGQALVSPPDARTIPTPFLEHVFVVAEPLTPQQAARVLRKYGTA